MSLVEIDDIHTYYGQSYILQGVSMDIDEGEIVALLGRNGAGKTTTIRSVMGIQPPRRGEIRYKGEDIVGRESYEISRAGVGFVPEDRRLFPELTVRENLETVMVKDSDWTVDRVYDVFPKLEERENNDGDQLSGGEQQMLAIARALVTDPEFLMLDEPSEGLAPIIVDDLRDLIADVTDYGITVLLTEQNVRFALALADRAFLIDKGQIQWSGTAEELKQNEELQDRYLTVVGEGGD
jgi:branched-chain amino acid transport system ATP-binding protein